MLEEMEEKPLQAKDFLGRDLHEGDNVVFMQLTYRSFLKGVIRRVTPKMVIIEHTRTNMHCLESRQLHKQVVKIDE